MFCPICHGRLALNGHEMVVAADTAAGRISTNRNAYRYGNVSCSSFMKGYIWTVIVKGVILHRLESCPEVT